MSCSAEHILTIACPPSEAASPDAAYITNKLLSRMESVIERTTIAANAATIIVVSHTPHSSPASAKIKSVCTSGSVILTYPSPGPRPSRLPLANASIDFCICDPISFSDARKRSIRSRTCAKKKYDPVTSTSPAENSVIISHTGIPAQTICSAHTPEISTVMPKSGCPNTDSAVSRNSPTASVMPGKSSILLFASSSHAVTTINTGLMNSDGCSENPANLIQRAAPLVASPTTYVSTTPANAHKKPNTASRRMVRRLCIETPIISTSPININTPCFFIKAKSSASRSRCAAEGLAESTSIAPIKIRKTASEKLTLSTVHHQLEILLLLCRAKENIAAPPPLSD